MISLYNLFEVLNSTKLKIININGNSVRYSSILSQKETNNILTNVKSKYNHIYELTIDRLKKEAMNKNFNESKVKLEEIYITRSTVQFYWSDGGAFNGHIVNSEMDHNLTKIIYFGVDG